jgi:hypothetical protein
MIAARSFGPKGPGYYCSSTTDGADYANFDAIFGDNYIEIQRFLHMST